ncbi:uncharacterized protein IL334_004684 [Kwoniella shivajii]|uniref:SEC7 domain-containing protein n=1 Tax=Kwoniella shivajii TaxID=564305 RepID=A0ABZ1D294_9TREE|nr:hypothetical protein IL334_004684 [Kwoniella shivajii]
MSSSPTKQYFYASRSSSRSGSRPVSPPTPAEVRSQAVAKLKRAASLPRRPDGRRPSLAQAIESDVPSTHPDEVGMSNKPPPPQSAEPSSLSVSPSPSDTQEILSPSPVATSFDHSNVYSSATPMQMQRSASPASSYHMTSSMPLNSPYQPNTPPVGDWGPMQLAQSYLPSLTPTGLSPNPYPHSVPIGVGAGRNTPSPLPTLGELATLQRSNSNAARAKAMSKLTGGRDTPAEDEFTLSTPTRVNLTRAGTLGGPRMLDLAANRPPAAEAPVYLASPSLALTQARPRLQRSFTVSSSNMGEERRSAVGRRMVERLAERRAARQKEEEEVRRLWQERRVGLETEEVRSEDNDAAQEDAEGSYEAKFDEEHQIQSDEHQQDFAYVNDLGVHHSAQPQGMFDEIPSFKRHSPQEPHQSAFPPGPQADLLNLSTADRPISRGTLASSQEPFEYESHLRRSLSSRTARGGTGGEDPLPVITTTEQDGHASGLQSHPVIHIDDEPLLPPQPHYATPPRGHMPHSSTSTQSTIRSPHSPGGSTLSGLDSMMFIMGGSAGLRPRTNAHPWPQEILDGSEWGTPAKDMHQATFNDSPIIRSPSGSDHALSSADGIPSDHEVDHTSPSRSTIRTDSVMSWEEVGGKDDQEIRVPSDNIYNQKTGSFSAKLKGSVRSAMKKRNKSRTSISSFTQSPPGSPMLHQPGSFIRRGSESSASHSFSQEHVPRHQPSVSSLAASSVDQSDTQATSIFQHQLSNDPSQVSFLPRANLNDPRIMSPKLSPFPGIAQLERKHVDGNLTVGEAPKLLHQKSDSAVPIQRAAPQESIYSLPLPTHPDDRRASADSATKRNWLSKAFGHPTSPRSSGSVSRKSSILDVAGESRTLGQGARIISSDVDPFAPSSPPQTLAVKPARHRSASPTVSVVPEVSEEGSRFTRFLSMKGQNGPLAVSKEEEEGLTKKSKDVLLRMDAVLALGPDDPDRPDILDDPPRKLLLSTQILQVVNAHTVKDRYLFLFNDILVIAKPMITRGIHATLDMKYIVKSIVNLDKLAVSGLTEEPTKEPPRHPVVTKFIDQFAQDPVSACSYLVERSNPKVDTATLASLIFKTPELDRAQIGHLLADNDRLMRHFIGRFNFLHVRIDEALRMFLLSIRLPTESIACEALLRGFAYRYFEANHSHISYDRELASELVLAIMQFNDALYGTFGFALPNHSINIDTFISAFKSKDPKQLVPTELLSDIFDSISTSQLVQALKSDENQLEKPVSITPRIPSKLTYNVWSEEILVSIPSPDPSFKVKLHGQGLEFDPPVLDFAHTPEQSFRVRGTSLGIHPLLFNRIGINAASYGNLGNTRLFTVERAFMKHTFHVSFTSHTGLRRKYCFSVPDVDTRRVWGKMLSRQITSTQQSKYVSATTLQQKIRLTAENVSIQVLRDALIPLEDKSLSSVTAEGIPGTMRGRVGSSQRGSNDKGRSGSVSISYTNALKEESDLGPLLPTKSNHHLLDRQSGLLDIQSGKELVLLCRQNSLLPRLLELLHSGKDDAEQSEPHNSKATQGYGEAIGGTEKRNKGIRV